MDPYASFPPNLHFYDASHPQTFSNAYHRHNVIPPAPYNSPRPILEDDRKLFNNFDRFLQGEIDQETFQAESCKRLLFTWEWVLYLCFLNYNQALKTWYQLLGETGDEDIWLWVDGDEQQSHERRIVAPNYREIRGPADLHPSCALSWANLRKAINILSHRSQNHEAPASLFSWRRQLDACGKPHLRFMAVAFAIATSRPLRALDSDRGIKDRTVWSLLRTLEAQLSNHWQETTGARPHQFQTYVAHLEATGHTCTRLWQDRSKSHCALFELVSITSPGRQIHLPIYWPWLWCHDAKHISCSQCEESRPLLLTDISQRIQAASVSPEALAAETPHTSAPKSYVCLLWWLWCSLPLSLFGVEAAAFGDVDGWLQWLRLLTYQPAIDIQENGDDYQAAHGLTRVLRHLLSQHLAEWLQSDPRNLNYSISKADLNSNNICDFESTKDLNAYIMYIPSSKEWRTAEIIFSDLTAAWYGNNDLVDVQSVCGVLAWWALNKGVTSHFPDYHSFLEATRFFEWHSICFYSRLYPQEELISRICNDKPKCCRKPDEGILEWYLASASLLLPESAITEVLVWRCECDETCDEDEAFRVFNNYSIKGNQGSRAKKRYKKKCRKLLDRLFETAEGYGVKPGICENRREIVAKPGIDNLPIGHQPQEENHLPFRPENMGTAELQEFVQAAEKELQRRALPTPSSRTLPKGNIKTNKSAQANHVKDYIVDLLRSLDNPADPILELIPREGQEISLPWKRLPKILESRGYAFKNWPEGVPQPDTKSQHSGYDGNKGILGLSARYIRMLYDATRSQDYPLGLRKVGEGEAVMPGARRARDGEFDRGEMEAGPSKRSRLNAPEESSTEGFSDDEWETQ